VATHPRVLVFANVDPVHRAVWSMEELMDDIPYLLRGITQLGTASSTLISSSKYLDNPRLRTGLRQNSCGAMGRTFRRPPVRTALRDYADIQNPAEVNALIAEERRKWPALDRWFAERRVSTYTERI